MAVDMTRSKMDVHRAGRQDTAISCIRLSLYIIIRLLASSRRHKVKKIHKRTMIIMDDVRVGAETVLITYAKNG